MYLVDTNIFLEILLKQDKSEVCKNFLVENPDNIYISDFTLHSIGVILFRQNASNVFSKFSADILPHITLLTLPKAKYKELAEASEKYGLDFDDAYQYCVAKDENLTVTTMDKDFRKVSGINVRYL